MTRTLPELSRLPGNHPSGTPADRYVYASSKDVAAHFSKRHADVLRAIRNLKCSGEFHRLNSAPFKISDLTGESTSHVDMTRDGFTFLVMGFTGKSAIRFKIAYIKAFNEMEERLRNMPPPSSIANPADAARAWADTHQARQLEEQGIVKGSRRDVKFPLDARTQTGV